MKRLLVWVLVAFLGAVGSSRAPPPPLGPDENILIFFPPESADLTERALQGLEMAVRRATEGGYGGAIVIGGYTDRAERPRGWRRIERWLSQHLAALGIEPGRLMAQARGDQPLTPGVAGEQNRRVQIPAMPTEVLTG